MKITLTIEIKQEVNDGRPYFTALCQELGTVNVGDSPEEAFVALLDSLYGICEAHYELNQLRQWLKKCGIALP